jgi:hypothetical protein
MKRRKKRKRQKADSFFKIASKNPIPFGDKGYGIFFGSDLIYKSKCV